MKEHLSSMLELQQIQRMQESSAPGTSLDLFKAAEVAHLSYSVYLNVPPDGPFRHPEVETTVVFIFYTLYIIYIIIHYALYSPVNQTFE